MSAKLSCVYLPSPIYPPFATVSIARVYAHDVSKAILLQEMQVGFYKKAVTYPRTSICRDAPFIYLSADHLNSTDQLILSSSYGIKCLEGEQDYAFPKRIDNRLPRKPLKSENLPLQTKKPSACELQDSREYNIVHTRATLL